MRSAGNTRNQGETDSPGDSVTRLGSGWVCMGASELRRYFGKGIRTIHGGAIVHSTTSHRR